MIDCNGNALEVHAARSGTAFDVTTLLSLADAKEFLKIDGTAEDANVTQLLTAALDLVQADTGVIAGPESYAITMDQIPADGAIVLPVWPVRSITSITVYGADYSAAVVSAALYQLVATIKPARIVAVSVGAGWPSVGATMGGVSIVAAAGFADAASVPEWFVAALKLRLAALYTGTLKDNDPVYLATIADGRLSWAG